MFDELLGNERVKAALKRYLHTGRVPNSLLFTGPDGVGKQQFALELARSFVCKNPEGPEPCGRCAACHRVAEIPYPKTEVKESYEFVHYGEHADIGIVYPFNRNILVKAIRNLETHANYRPFEARARVFLIDDADKMNDSSANALLKTLEEPPATSYIILITSRPDSLLATIRSRCQLVRFAPVATAEIEQFLIEKKGMEPGAAALAARLAGGSVGKAVSLKIDEFVAQRERMLSVLENVIETTNRTSLLRISEEINDAKNKDNFGTHLDILETLVRDVWRLKTSSEETELVNIDIAPRLHRYAQVSSGQQPAKWIGEIEILRQNLIVNLNKKVSTDALFMRMANG